MYRWKKAAVWGILLCAVSGIGANYLGTLLPAQVVGDLEGGVPIGKLLGDIGFMMAILWICSSLANAQDAWQQFIGRGFLNYFRKKYHRKIMDIDYERLENQECQDTLGSVAASVNFGRGIGEAARTLDSLGSVVPMVIFYGILLGRESVWLFLLSMATVGMNLWLLAFARKKHSEYYGKLSMESRKIAYVNERAENSAAGKDVRIYHLLDWFLKKYEDSLDGLGSAFTNIHLWYLIRSLADAALTFGRNAFVYLYLLRRLTQGGIGASLFVYYIGLINVFTSYFESFIRLIMPLNNINMSICYIRDFLGWQDDWKREGGIGAERLAAVRKKPVKLELRDVSFRYPKSERNVLSHISLTLEPGEKLALLGLNGEGKTTLVKLICGFYHPTEGQIFLNDIPIEQFEREEYYSLTSVLFQDSTMLPLSLDENLTGQAAEDIDRDRLHKALEISGFLERYERLPQKGETMLVREVNEESIEFSGGEKQKLLFARALYQPKPLVILDEPTAALDPIAENELYQHYGEAMKNSTSIYISHRLSSTRFCDRIVLLENGSFVEEGTHEELMQKNGRYAGLFEMQSQYYREGGKKDEEEGF